MTCRQSWKRVGDAMRRPAQVWGGAACLCARLSLLAALGLVGGAVPAAGAQQVPDPVEALLGRAYVFCSWEGRPFDIVVQQADWGAGPDGAWRVVLVVQVTYEGSGATGAYLTIRLRDERGRVFDFARAGSGVDVLDLAREYGALTPTMPVQMGRPARHLWAFVVPPDAEALQLVQDAQYAC
jgi:hypothetical protein